MTRTMSPSKTTTTTLICITRREYHMMLASIFVLTVTAFGLSSMILYTSLPEVRSVGQNLISEQACLGVVVGR